MWRVPIVDTDSPDHRIDFYHINSDAPAGTWRKETVFRLDNIKINIFMEGEFSVIVGEKSYRPAYGDVCFLPPFKMHCGQIPKQTHIDYYQLDIGIKALEFVTGGNELISSLITKSNENDTFFRPDKKESTQLIQLCNQLEHTIAESNLTLAYAYVIEILSKINSTYKQDGKCATFSLSKLTQDVIRYIENNYDSRMTIHDIANLFGVSSSYLSRIFKKEVGVGVHEYLTKHRVLQASYLLQNHSVAEVCYMCGFNDSSHFISVFKKYLDCTPNVYKKKALRTNM